MTNTLRSFLLLTVLAQPAFAQTTKEGLTLPPGQEDAATPEDSTATDQAQQTDLTLPPATTSQEEADRAERIAALRAEFEVLKQRAATDAALRQPVTEQTLRELAAVEATIAEIGESAQIDAWKAQTLEFFVEAFAAESRVLPEGIPPGVQPEPAVVVIDTQTTLYAQPAASADMVMRTLLERTSALRVAEVGSYSLIWSSEDDFAFVLTQYLQVY